MTRPGLHPDLLALAHHDSGDNREVCIDSRKSLYGSELLTLCGHWLPAWEDGPDGEANRRRWLTSEEPRNPACSVCVERAKEEW